MPASLAPPGAPDSRGGLTATADAPEHPAPAKGSVPLIGLLVVIAALGYAADQLVKAWVVAELPLNVSQEFVGTLLQLRRTDNPGAAFSLATNATWLLTLIAVAVVVTTIFVARRLRSRAWAVALGLLVGGALGNLTDRFVRAPGGGQGHVVDYLQLPHWPIFNLADVCIVSAAVLICLLAFLGIGVDGTRVGDEDDQDEAADERTATDRAEGPTQQRTPEGEPRA